MELAKKYGGDEDASFINGVLGKYAQGVEKPDAKHRPLSAETGESDGESEE